MGRLVMQYLRCSIGDAQYRESLYLFHNWGKIHVWLSPMRAAMSLDTRYFFNPTEHMELMRGKPFLAIVGTEAQSAPFSEVAVERSKKAGGEAELFKVKGAQHFDLYDKHKYVNQAVDKLDSFYRTTLK